MGQDTGKTQNYRNNIEQWLAVGGGWWRMAVGSWWRLAVGGWWLTVGGPWGLSLTKKLGFSRTALLWPPSPKPSACSLQTFETERSVCILQQPPPPPTHTSSFSAPAKPPTSCHPAHGKVFLQHFKLHLSKKGPKHLQHALGTWYVVREAKGGGG